MCAGPQRSKRDRSGEKGYKKMHRERMTPKQRGEANRRRRVNDAARKKAVRASTRIKPNQANQAKIASALSPANQHSRCAALVEMSGAAAGLLEKINEMACSNSLDNAEGFEWVHGEPSPEPGVFSPTVAMWLPPQAVERMAKRRSTTMEQPWVAEVPKLLIQLEQALPEWATVGCKPALLVYPTKKVKEGGQLQNPHLEFGVGTTEQVIHVGQAVGCPARMNFVCPSKTRGWAKVHKVPERGLVGFCREHQGNLESALSQRGIVEFSVAPGGGRAAMAFPSATPHRGVGPRKAQTSMVFWQGEGAAAYLTRASKPGSAGANLFAGNDASGAKAGGCFHDAVAPVEGILAHIEPIGDNASITTQKKQGQPQSVLQRAVELA